MTEKRYVYGTRTKKWYLVGKDDRDYAYGITKSEMKTLGKEKAKKKYLSPTVLYGTIDSKTNKYITAKGKRMKIKKIYVENKYGKWNDREAQMYCDFGGVVLHKGKKHYLYVPVRRGR